MLRFVVFLLGLLALAGCTVPGAKVQSLNVSRIGLINLLPAEAAQVYRGVTVFENNIQSKPVSWSFPDLAGNMLADQAGTFGATVVDLTALPDVRAIHGEWFTYGYTFDLGYAKHALPADREALLARMMDEQDLDIVLMLGAADYNEDISHDEAHPVGAFGIFERPRLFGDNPISTFVQLEGRVIAGTPPAVLEDLNGSNNRKLAAHERSLTVTEPLFQQKIEQQLRDAVAKIVGNLGI
ncbi:hypothetical protein [Pelagibius sp. 7325]|uniref:hypothetical protein n=1 Tax=Pelagibius sp. 7325 TaxID=3131994 RepID=UPI0030ECE824